VSGSRISTHAARARRAAGRLRRQIRPPAAAPEAALPPAVEATIARAREEHLTYLEGGPLRTLAAAVGDIEAQGLPGVLIEAGAARGGSAIVLAAAKARERPLKVYDVFEMIPAPSRRVQRRAHPGPVRGHDHAGRTGRLAHLDGDWYESTMTCLERIAPRLVPGGRIVLDDYDTWSGCRTAVDEYFKDRKGFRLERRDRLHVVRD
jgi:hypothetical protein